MDKPGFTNEQLISISAELSCDNTMQGKTA